MSRTKLRSDACKLNLAQTTRNVRIEGKIQAVKGENCNTNRSVFDLSLVETTLDTHVMLAFGVPITLATAEQINKGFGNGFGKG